MRPASRWNFGLILCLFVAPLHAESAPTSEILALAEAIGPADARRAISGLSARAEAIGPRGAFSSEILSLADGTARFRLAMQASTTDLLIAADKPYLRSGAGALEAADAAMASFLRGHEVHRMLLDLERRFRPDESFAARALRPGCLPLRGPDGLAVTICRASADADTDAGLPRSIELELPAALGGGSTTIEIGDWRSLHGVRLPFTAEFLHAGERHSYRYTEVLPFRLAPGSALPPASALPAELFARLGDLADLVSAHERVLAAHRQSDVEVLLGDAAGRSTISGRGRLTESSRDELAARLGPYLEQIRFSRYEDVVVPVVAVSADGSLGWLACQIEAAGTQRVAPGSEGSAAAVSSENSAGAAGSPGAGGPLTESAESAEIAESAAIAYGFSWVELYARQDGRWRNIGNASSARP